MKTVFVNVCHEKVVSTFSQQRPYWSSSVVTQRSDLLGKIQQSSTLENSEIRQNVSRILIGSVICPQDYSDMFCDKDSRVIQLHLPIDRSQVILAEVIATTIALTQSGRPFPGLLHPFAHAYFQFSFLSTLFNNLANGNLIPLDVHGKTLFSIRLSFFSFTVFMVTAGALCCPFFQLDGISTTKQHQTTSSSDRQPVTGCYWISVQTPTFCCC